MKMSDEELFYVEYKVPAMTGAQLFKQGPWPKARAEEELRDISGYEGVTEARLKPMCKEADPCREPDCADCCLEG